MIRSFVHALVALTAVATLIAAPAAAQLVPIRTVPVASGDQFLTLPAANLGMGGVRLAVDDSLADPWANPGKGVFIRESSFIGAPTFYSISDQGGAGKTFPVAGLFHGESWYGGASLALQQIKNDNRRGRFFFEPLVIWDGPPRRLSDLSSQNLYVRGFVGRRLGAGPWSMGVGLSAAHLDAVDGVDLLYAGADRIEQSGSSADVRLGLYRTGERDRLSLVAVHNRISMTHDVTWIDFIWDDDPMVPPVVQPRLEVNEEETRTWGGQIAWDRDLVAPGWRVGVSATVNRKSHPKIPNYEIQNIPRDPGTTWAYEAGFGIAWTQGATTFGFDVVLQPIWSETWQEADERITAASGKVIEVGGKTIENEFFFTNVILRTGISHELGTVALQAGLSVRSYDYELEQTDHVDGTFRDQGESWMEWTPTFGATFRLSDLELRYAGLLTTGTGRPGVARQFDVAVAESLATGSDFIIAPEAPLTLQEATVLTHQLSVRIPVR